MLICTRFRNRPTPALNVVRFVDRVGHPEPRLEAVLRRLGEAVRHAVIQALQIRQLREVRERLVGRARRRGARRR